MKGNKVTTYDCNRVQIITSCFCTYITQARTYIIQGCPFGDLLALPSTGQCHMFRLPSNGFLCFFYIGLTCFVELRVGMVCTLRLRRCCILVRVCARHVMYFWSTSCAMYQSLLFFQINHYILLGTITRIVRLVVSGFEGINIV